MYNIVTLQNWKNNCDFNSPILNISNFKYLKINTKGTFPINNDSLMVVGQWDI
jgi:hypothetical protein